MKEGILKNILINLRIFLLPLARIAIRRLKLPRVRRYLWKNFSSASVDFQVNTIYGTKVYGNTTDFIQKQIYFFGVWEPNLSNWMVDRFKKLNGRIFVDVGANIGYYSVLASKYIHNGAVISIEAYPPIFKKLEHNVNINNCNNVRLVPFAVTDKRCSIPMYYGGGDNEGKTSTLARSNNDRPDITVRGQTLSEIVLDEEVDKIGLIKVDVEGAEYDVVMGMVAIINKLKDDVVIIIEITPESQSMEKITEIFSMFSSFGYLSYVIPANNLGVSNTTDSFDRPVKINAIPKKQEDIIFTKTVL